MMTYQYISSIEVKGALQGLEQDSGVPKALLTFRFAGNILYIRFAAAPLLQRERWHV